VLERGFIDPVRTISLSTRVRIANSPKSAALRRRQSAAVLLAIFLTSGVGLSQPSSETVKIEVHANQADGAFPSVWNFFGYDEPNYTYAPNGTKLLNELSALSPSPVYVRVHNLLTTGDGTASLKWGSTNVYTEDAAGNPQYSWAIVDRIFDAFQAAGVKPLVEIGFMPEALSTHPQPYRHNFPQESAGGIFTGWAYPPNDYQKWSDLVFKFVQHLRNRYGDEGIHTWLWEVWNEPDIPYWKGTPEEFFKLYDVSVNAVLRAFPEARIGGPDTTGPANAKAAEFLRQFLEHCAHGKNYASGKIGSHLDFISFHPKGSPTWKADHVQMGIDHQLAAIDQGFEIVASFPEWRRTPIVLGESDPEGCAACSAKKNPQNSYRNGPLYGAYTTEVLNNILVLARDRNVNFLGAVTWAFEFEDQPPFEGFRELATNGIDKPVLNVFRMFGLLGNDRIKATSTGALRAADILHAGVRGQSDVNAIATRKDREIEVLIWNYHDDDVPSAAASIDLSFDGLPEDAKRGLLEHFRVDSDHSNSFSAWKEMGSPLVLSQIQSDQLQKAGQLQQLGSPARISIEKGAALLHFTLPRQGISLIRLGW
jgi:xylan 1,4-beta-xylosidase